jgi:hypothetical protein
MIENAFTVVVFSWEYGAMLVKSSAAVPTSLRKVSSRLLTCSCAHH